MKYSLLRKLLAIAALAAPSLAVQAAQTLTFPTSAITAGSARLYQLSTNTAISPGGTAVFGVGGTTTVSGFGVIDSFSTGLCVGCELTYVFDGFTDTGFSANGQRLFSGGSLRMYVDFTPDAVNLPNTTVQSGATSALTAFNNARSSYEDGILLVSATARAAAVSVPGSSTVSNNVSQSTLLSQNQGCPAGTMASTSNFSGSFPTGTLTLTCTSPSASVMASLFVSPSGLQGVSAFDVKSGQGFSNFAPHNTQFLNPFAAATPLITLADISTQFGVTGPAQSCGLAGVNGALCTGTLSAASFVSPTTVVLVPEPQMLALFGLALAGLGGAVSRRRKLMAK